MLLDNENKNLKVHEWITKFTEEGKLDIVTGYFTVGALAFLSNQVKEKITDFRFVLGDIVNVDIPNQRALDLLNENISVNSALKLSKVAQEAVAFLKQENVIAKTLEPNFCHAKAYIHHAQNDDRFHYFISGSSNLTEAGTGLKTTSNIELNIGETGNNSQYNELVEWFDELWKKPQAHTHKTLFDENGKKYTKPFKQYLIEEIEKIFVEYTPKELYYKFLFELFGSQLLRDKNDPEFNRQVGRLENTVIYQTLYEFQQKGVLSLIKMLQKYNGAILADAVGLGKTWSALAVMKFFQMKGREVILLCPKKLENNWHRYLKNQDSKFEKDQLDYFVRFHTDMQDIRLEKYKDRADSYFTNDKPKLIVIDESHNLRNHKSGRYQFFLNEVLKRNEDIKVLMLSATPINNSLADIRNQFKLMVKGNPHGFDSTLGIRNIDYTFRSAQKSFNDWRAEPNPKIGDFIKKIPANFFKLTDSLIVARTRKMIEGQQSGLTFPVKAKPLNLFVTPSHIGNFESFEELFDHFPPMLSGYQPSFYIEQEEDIDITKDEKQRDRFLVKMLYILMVKRLESSWFSFSSTVQKIMNHHQNALNKIGEYQKAKKNSNLDEDDTEEIFEDDELADEIEEFTLGKKRKVSLSDIDDAGNLPAFKKDLKKDIDALDLLHRNLLRFQERQTKELKKENNHKSIDDKLEELIKQIKKKRKNNPNQKVIIFTVYKDTAFYLFDQLKARGFTHMAAVSGGVSRVDDVDFETRKFEPILERFAPFTKLFKEREWTGFEPSSEDLPMLDKFKEWKTWIEENDKKANQQIQKPIDILIATDSLSEGQNLQDCDMVINYDIHWNPVRIIQRMGRIDRLGSPNDKVYGINFFPSNNINSYLNLQGRIEQRMAAMKLAGSEVNMEFSESFAEMAKDDDLEAKQKNHMLKQMEVSFDDIDGEKSFGFDDLSLEQFRQDLLAELKEKENYYLQMPKGVYTGFKITDKKSCPQKGIIALMGYPSSPPKAKIHEYLSYELVYINDKGEEVLLNQKEVLDALTVHKEEARFVPKAIDKGEEKAINALATSIQKWMDAQAVEEQKTGDGTTEKRMGQEAKDVLAKLKSGDRSAIKRIKKNEKVTDKYKAENFDLIAWFLVN